MDFVPTRLLRHSVHGRALVPHFLGAWDHPWLRALLDEAEAACLRGATEGELEELLRSVGDRAAAGGDGWSPSEAGAPMGRIELASFVLMRKYRAPRPPRSLGSRLRAALFSRAPLGTPGQREQPGQPSVLDFAQTSRTERLAAVAQEFGLDPAEVEAQLFSDLPGQRPIVAPTQPLSTVELAARSNLALVQSLLLRARRVRISGLEQLRPLVRQAHLRGLLCVVTDNGLDNATLEISGPYSLFRHTLLYGRALAELVPLVAWCRRFRLEAHCVVGEREVVLTLNHTDPIFPAAEPRRYDSQLEARLARDLRRHAPDWELLREPEAIAIPPLPGALGAPGAARLIFPDFALVHRHLPDRKWLVEIVGFWTPDYLREKLADYRAARLSNLILCIDDRLACADDELPRDAKLLRFHARVDAMALLALIDPARLTTA